MLHTSLNKIKVLNIQADLTIQPFIHYSVTLTFLLSKKIEYRGNYLFKYSKI